MKLSYIKSRFKSLLLVTSAILAFLTSSCVNLDDIYSRLSKLEVDMEALQAAVASLQKAYNDGKIITNVTPITAGTGGWTVTFSDGSAIAISNGANGKDGEDGTNGIDGIDGITPFLKVDQDGYWAVSYDNGDTFTALLDSEGNRIQAVGKDGIDGEDGEAGAEGVSVRIIINDDGYYVIQTYLQSDPETTLTEEVTTYPANVVGVVTSFTEDDTAHTMTITLADGSEFTFHMTYITPTGIVILSAQPVRLVCGSSNSIRFRVNPSNAIFNYDLTSEDCEIELDCIGTRSGYATAPLNYHLEKIEQVYDETTNELKQGEYRAIIRDDRISTTYDDNAALVLNVTDVNGDKVQISSSIFEVKWECNVDTGLPILFINTPNNVAITSKEEWTSGVQMTIMNPDGSYDYEGSMQMKGRGNSTWNFAKKPYALKLDKKSSILGMAKHKRWCLLANWLDRTLMRNAVAFEIARKTTGLVWTPRGEFVEVVLNGTHQGNYYLCEQIKVDANRVNIAELDEDATSGEALEGGYIMELDTSYDEVWKFKSEVCNLPWQFKDPDEVNSAQFSYMQNYVNAMEHALYDNDKFAAREFTKYMDLDSFADYLFVYELAQCWEMNWPKSVFMVKDKGAKMKIGPVWDFDWGTFNPNLEHFLSRGIYYDRLYKDAAFCDLLRERWAAEKSRFEEVETFIDETAAKIKRSNEVNIKMWPITQVANEDENLTFDEAVARLKEAFRANIEWFDTRLQSL